MRRYIKSKKPSPKPVKALICIVAISLLLITASQSLHNIWYIKVGKYSITKPQYEMWRGIVVEDFMENYEGYVSALKIDVTKPIDGQIMNNDVTWGEYFDATTDMEIYTVLSVLNEISAEGIDYRDNVRKEEYVELEKKAAAAGTDVNHFIKLFYSKNLSEEKAEDVIAMRDVSRQYLMDEAETLVSESDYNSYYEQNKCSLDSASAYIIELENTRENISLLESLKSNISDVDSFIKKAHELQGSSGYTEYKSMDKCPSHFSSWLFSSASGSMSISASEDSCYLVMKDRQWKNVNPTVNAHMIMFSGGSQEENADAAQSFIDNFNNTDKSEQSFANMVFGRTGNDGYIEGIVEHQITRGMADWLFSSERKHGDVSMLMNGENMYVFFWDGYGDETWKALAKEEICSEKYNELASAARNKYVFKKR